MSVPPFRLRTLMIAVAVVGFAIGGAVEARRLRRLASTYRGMAASHAQMQQFWTALYNVGNRNNEIAPRRYEWRVRMIKDSTADDAERERMLADARKLLAYTRDEAGWYGKLIAYHSHMRRKYERAASRPWESVSPDSPAPPAPKVPKVGIE